MPKWGFNYSEMAKYRFLTDPNTFWMILGTSKMFAIFWTRGGPLHPVFLMNVLQKIQEKSGNILGKNIIDGNLRIELFEIFEILETLGVHFLSF